MYTHKTHTCHYGANIVRTCTLSNGYNFGYEGAIEILNIFLKSSHQDASDGIFSCLRPYTISQNLEKYPKRSRDCPITVIKHNQGPVCIYSYIVRVINVLWYTKGVVWLTQCWRAQSSQWGNLQLLPFQT